MKGLTRESRFISPGMDPVTQTRQQRRHDVILTSGSGNNSPQEITHQSHQSHYRLRHTSYKARNRNNHHTARLVYSHLTRCILSSLFHFLHIFLLLSKIFQNHKQQKLFHSQKSDKIHQNIKAKNKISKSVTRIRIKSTRRREGIEEIQLQPADNARAQKTSEENVLKSSRGASNSSTTSGTSTSSRAFPLAEPSLQMGNFLQQ